MDSSVREISSPEPAQATPELTASPASAMLVPAIAWRRVGSPVNRARLSLSIIVPSRTRFLRSGLIGCTRMEPRIRAFFHQCLQGPPLQVFETVAAKRPLALLYT